MKFDKGSSCGYVKKTFGVGVVLGSAHKDNVFVFHNIYDKEEKKEI